MVNEMKMTKSVPRKLESILTTLIGLFFLISAFQCIYDGEDIGFALAGILLSIPFFVISIALIIENPKATK